MMAEWTWHAPLWVEDGPEWTGRTATAHPDGSLAQDGGAPLVDDGGPLWFREPGPLCAPGTLSPPCPWELRWPAAVRDCPHELLLPWWEAIGPWADCGPLIAHSLVWKAALFATGARDPAAERSGLQLDTMRGTGVAAQSHLGTRGLAIDARHHLLSTSVRRSGGMLGMASPLLADLKDMASTAATRVELVEVRAFVPLDAVATVTATRRFSDTRPLLGRERRGYDAHGHGPLDHAAVALSLHDGWRRHHVTLYVDGEAAGWPYESAAFEQWVGVLIDNIARARPVRMEVAEDGPFRWTRQVMCDGAVPLSAPADRLLAR
jgi:hypothetical protein